MRALQFRMAQSFDFELLAKLRADSAAADEYDPYSTMESLPDKRALRELAADADRFEVVHDEATLLGYSWTRHWTEDSGTLVVLCDWYCTNTTAPELQHSILLHVESVVDEFGRIEATSGEVVVGTNASSIQANKADAIKRAGYVHVFSQIEMEWGGATETKLVPSGITVRHATVEDAAALIDLTRRVWSGRDYFTMPTVEGFTEWLETSDLTLFYVATDSSDRLVGFVASKPHNAGAEIEDVQVDPAWQRRGLASALLVMNIANLRERGIEIIRLNTEGHDPAGARSLYEQLGFEVTREYMRYRKPFSERAVVVLPELDRDA